ncbi:pyridoxal phosphate-dependent aminotransferase [Viridibacillus sp. YIM B01967]|uniref:cysteine-S-conjugate beta-lyase n=1 Tax=Viridibacillus soli TaxID=2798301 RepID=A0ABS1H9U7_9BACL|nr:MalY/PatB family protein [Viridibacillus soli]MBK3496194.1 pyridoxal phosphate-dependent aminotransferase [Viridibacillus soli]
MSRFDEVINRRNTNSLKWDMMEAIYQIEDASTILPMWVADMDFAAPEVVIKAIGERLNHAVLGYSIVDDSTTGSFVSWVKKRHDWTINKDWVLYHSGVVPAIASIVETFTKPQDKILITPPVYPPFSIVPTALDRGMEECVMVEKDGQYSLDFDAFEKSAAKEEVKLFILCNPHNPGGIVWSEDDLREMLRLCTKYNVLILADEIHADLMFDGHKHTPLAKIASEEDARIITCMAPTKTFNLAGVQIAMMIVSDDAMRSKLSENSASHGQMGPNTFAIAAMKAVYTEGEEWLAELLAYLSANMDLVIEKIPAAVPGINITKPQGTYLLWIDYRETGLEEQEVMERLLHTGKLALDPGSKYGESGRGFLRMNIACPRATLEDGIERFIKAFK